MHKSLKAFQHLTTIVLCLALFITSLSFCNNGYSSYAETMIGGETIDSAQHLSLGETYDGTAVAPKTYFYSFTTTSAKDVKYRITGYLYSDDIAMYMQLYDSQWNLVNEIYADDLQGNSAGWRICNDQKIPQKGIYSGLKTNTTYFIKMQVDGYGAGDFTFNVSMQVDKPKQVVVSSCKPQKKKVALAWYKVPYASKYQIQYKKAGSNKWIKKESEGTKLLVKKLKSNKKYKFRVRALRTVDGNTYYGEWSKPTTVKVK